MLPVCGRMMGEARELWVAGALKGTVILSYCLGIKNACMLSTLLLSRHCGRATTRVPQWPPKMLRMWEPQAENGRVDERLRLTDREP